MSESLKPCPFCGKGAIKWTEKKNGKTLKFAGCLNELCAAERWKLNIVTWNKRPLEEEIHAHYKKQIRNSEEAAVAVYKHYQDIIVGAYQMIEETCPHLLTEDKRGIKLTEFTVDNI